MANSGDDVSLADSVPEMRCPTAIVGATISETPLVRVVDPLVPEIPMM